jgi:hypothetical protein
VQATANDSPQIKRTFAFCSVIVFPSRHSFFSDPLYRPAVCSFASFAFSHFSRLLLLQRKYAYYGFSSTYFVEVTECRRSSGIVLLVFSSGIWHVMLTAILTADECQSLYLQQFLNLRVEQLLHLRRQKTQILTNIYIRVRFHVSCQNHSLYLY